MLYRPAYRYTAVAGNYLLMMFYTVVSGWFLKYFFQMIGGKFVGLSGDEIVNVFVGETVGSPSTLLIWMVVVIVIGFGTCFLGLQKGVERITKIMMSALMVIMIGLAIYVAFLPGAGAGYAFYLKPNFKALVSGEHGLWKGVKYGVETLYDEIPQIKTVLNVVHIITTVILIVILLIVMVGETPSRF